MTRRLFVVLSALGLLSSALSPARGLELSLEENRGQRGSVGYVDMARVFKLYPETLRAKEAFEDAIRQAEDQLNLRKAELMRLRGEVAKLKAERDAVAQRAAAAQPASTTQAPAAPAQGAAVAASTVPAIPPAAAVSSTSTPALAVPLPPQAPAPAPAQAAPEPISIQLASLDESLGRKVAELDRKEGEFRLLQAATEKDLAAMESRKTDQLLGRIHRVLQEVARKEGISVVVDKSGILFGHEAVDLTEKVLLALRGGELR